MSNTKKKRMEQERKRKLRQKKKLEKVVLGVITAAIIVFVGFHYATNKTDTTTVITNKNSSEQQLSSFDVNLITGGTLPTSTLNGHPFVLWLMTTWCSSCAETSQILVSEYYGTMKADGIRLLQVENYNDLNENGESLPSFAAQYGGDNQSGWFIGYAPQWVTQKYNPDLDLDIYYLVDSSGYIVGSGQGLGAHLNSVVQTLGS